MALTYLASPRTELEATFASAGVLRNVADG